MLNRMLLVVYCFVMFGCSERNAEVGKMDDWVQEEILNQLNDLRKEIVDLKKEIKGIDGKLENHLMGKKNIEVDTVSLSDIDSIGSEDAKFAIVEFSDFQCPFCARHDREVFLNIKEKYVDTGKIQYMVRDFPLSFHGQAREAAIAAHCAGEQGEYWSMRKKLFSGGVLDKEKFNSNAASLNLDVDEFEECISIKKYEYKVDAGLALGEAIGVSGTPRFYLGRIEGENLVDVVILSGAQPFSAFDQVIMKVINKKS